MWSPCKAFGRLGNSILGGEFMKNIKRLFVLLLLLVFSISAYKEVYFDKTSHMSYRQHGNNVIGSKKGLAKYWDILFKKVKDPKFIHQRQRNAN